MVNDYAHPEILVDTQWVEDNKKNSQIRIVEVDYDPTLNYDQGHIENSFLFEWKNDLNDPVTRSIVNKQQLSDLLSKTGIGKSTTIVLYGDFNNWFAAYAFWILKYYGHEDVKIMNGGRKKWIDEDRDLTLDIPNTDQTDYISEEPDESLRAYFTEIKDGLKDQSHTLVDVRSPAEFSGEVLAPPEYPTEMAQRGGHIPAANNVPWASAVNEDGTFKTFEELQQIYQPKGITEEKDIIAYCRIGERSSHTWLVLKYLLGYPNVKNYDGSWTEWGNMVNSPIEK